MGYCRIDVPNVPPGRYAIAVGQDINNDGHPERMPWSPELKGISNYERKLWGWPDFETAAVSIAGPQFTITIGVF